MERASMVGASIGPYQIESKIGEGGMGEVYRARDTKLGRTVAVKTLPVSLADDPDRFARFHREAQVLAALNHPNIAQIYGFEDSGTTHALVMELIEGPTLADRLEHGAVPLQEALAIARQIATALDAAHEQGIVHRDLKPANIKVKEDGTVKVLDFGLAKALGPEGSNSSLDAANSPTLTARATQLGMILGTAAYMAPEQAKGKPVDRRADIWAFGVVLFEMLAGQRAFKGDDVSDVLAAVLRQEIEWPALPSNTPPNVRRILVRCLERDPKKRFRDIGDVLMEIDAPDAPVSAPVAPAPATSTSPFLRWLPWAVAAIVAAASLAWIATHRPAAEPHPVLRTAETVDSTAAFLTVSRDGSRLVYAVAGDRGSIGLAFRSLDQFAGRVVSGTEGGMFAVLSPDAEWVAFSGLNDSKIRKVAVGGGSALVLCDGILQNGATWTDDNNLIFAGQKGLMRVSANGGTPEQITTLDAAKGETAHSHPQVLPGGRQLLFTATTQDGPQFAVQDLGKPDHRIIARGGANGRYVSTGHLTYVRGATLIAVPFDVSRLEVVGGEVPVVEDVSTLGPAGTADYTVSSTGLLAYFTSPENGGTTLAWADRSGVTKPLPGPSRRGWGTGRLSPDGHFVANAITNAKGGRDIWTYDVDRGALMELTFGAQAEVNDFPIFSNDGRRVYYSGVTGEERGLFVVPADASAKTSLLLKTDGNATPTSVSPDGKWLLYHQAGPNKYQQVMVLDLTGGTAQPRPLHDAVAPEINAVFSRDGKYVAYQSFESGGTDVYVVPFPGPGAKTKVSLEGGQYPRWSVDGKELLYWANLPTSRLMTVEVTTTPAFRPGQPRELYRQLSTTTWDVTSDKNKFLVELSSRSAATTLAIVSNWFEELRRRAPAKK